MLKLQQRRIDFVIPGRARNLLVAGAKRKQIFRCARNDKIIGFVRSLRRAKAPTPPKARFPTRGRFGA
jgi:hypothetical protein